MLRSIALENFKAYERLEDLELRPLTVFCGPNGVGKSSVIQALLMMQQTINQQLEGKPSSLVTDGESVSLGDWVDVLFGHDSERAMSVELTVPLTWGVKGFWGKPATLTLKLKYTTRLSNRTEPADWDTFRARLDGPELTYMGLIAKEDNGQDLVAVSITQDACQGSTNGVVTGIWGERITLTFGEHIECSDRLFGNPDFEGIPGWEPGPCLEPTERWFEKISPDGVTLTEWNDDCGATELVGLVSRMLYEVSSQLMVRYVGPAREIPQRYYDAGEVSTTTGPRRRGERDWKVDFANARGAYEPPSPPDGPIFFWNSTAGMISTWLKYLGLPEVHPVFVGRDLRFMVSSHVEGCSVSVADTGYGVSQVLPVLLAGLFAREGEVLVLDQPELHLHPRVQAGMADFAVAVAKSRVEFDLDTPGGREKRHIEREGHQVLVETHSDHFVNRIVRRVVEGEIDSDDVAVYFVTPTSDGPHVEMVEVDPTFGIKNWPLGFFDDFSNDQEAIIRASIERRSRGEE